MQGNQLSLKCVENSINAISMKLKHQILRTPRDTLCLNIRGKDLDDVQKVKYLGVQVDDSLDWKEQIKAMSSKVSKALALVKHVKFFLLVSSLKSLYLSIKSLYLSNHYTLEYLNHIFAIAALFRVAVAETHFNICKNCKIELLEY